MGGVKNKTVNYFGTIEIGNVGNLECVGVWVL